jgi:single-strand DNA-binding protein
MNSVHLIGNLATDVELRDAGPKEEAEQKKVASFLLAVDRGSRDGGADFVWVTAWDRQAELCAEYLSKGGRVAVDGRLKSRMWEQDGKRRDAVEVVARRVEFLTRPSGEPSQEISGGEVIPFEAATA